MNWLGNGSEFRRGRNRIQQMPAGRFQKPVDIHGAHVLVFLTGSLLMINGFDSMDARVPRL